ncbi:unnamed protein product [Closterium sp. NIES-64]|nr:unnamed protein product [Closterium sp. NIES-64]
MSVPDVNKESIVVNASKSHDSHRHQHQQDRHQQQMQPLYQQKDARKPVYVPEMMREEVTDGDELPDRWDSCEGDDAAATQSNGIAKTCAHCGTSKTPLWRNGPPGPKSLCNACGIRFNKIRSGKRKASPQEAAMLREYDSADPAFSKPLPQSPVHKARSRLPRPRAGLFVYAPSSCCEGLPSAATSSNSDCGSPVEGPEEGEVCDEPMHVGKKVCLRHEEQQLGNKVDEDDVVLGAELLVSLSSALSDFSAHAATDIVAKNNILAGRRAKAVRFDEPTEADAEFESAKPPAINDKPLIGILSQPGDGDGGKAPRVNLNQAVDTPYDEGSYGGAEVGRHRAVDTNVSYIAASYAKWVESAGARPVPLLYDEPVEVLRQKFDMINGLLIPGGGTDLVPGPFMSTVQLLLQWAKEANDRGDYFPVQATCMGFEAMAIVISEFSFPFPNSPSPSPVLLPLPQFSFPSQFPSLPQFSFPFPSSPSPSPVLLPLPQFSFPFPSSPSPSPVLLPLPQFSFPPSAFLPPPPVPLKRFDPDLLELRRFSALDDPNLLELRRFSALDLASPLKFVGNWVHRRSYFSWCKSSLSSRPPSFPLVSLCLHPSPLPPRPPPSAPFPPSRSQDDGPSDGPTDGTTVHRFLSNSKLRDFFFVLTTSFDKNGLEYVTTVQGKRYPFYGTQWHPEKNAYEWGLDHIPHGAHAIAVGQAAANFFVNEARRNTHSPASDESMNDMLLYNHAPVFAGKNGHGYFEQSYVFRKAVGSGDAVRTE